MKKPWSFQLFFVFSGSPWYSKVRSPICIQTVPTEPAGSSLPASSRTLITLLGQALPTVPGLLSQSCGLATVPPPSVAA